MANLSRASLLLLSLLWLPNQSSAATHSDQQSQRSKGVALAATCSGCHAASNQAIPALLERSESELYQLLLAYKNDDITGTVMNRLVRGYSEEELQLIAGALGQ